MIYRYSLGFIFSFILCCSNIPFLEYDIESAKREYANCEVRYESEGKKFYAILIDVFVSVKGNAAVSSGSLAVNHDALTDILIGWNIYSVNSILFPQIGVWIKKVRISYIEDNKDEFGERWGEDVASGIVFAEGDSIIFRDAQGYSFSSPENSWRMLIWSDSNTSYAVLGDAGVKIAGDHTRNIIAHELGHNFGLEHGGTQSNVMHAIIRDKSIDFTDPEIETARNKLEDYDTDENRFYVEGQAPCKSDAEASIAHFNNTASLIANNVSLDSSSFSTSAGSSKGEEGDVPILSCGVE